MSDVIKGTKLIKNRVLFEHTPDSFLGKKKKRAGKRNTDSLDFIKTISTEVGNLKESLSHHIQQQADFHKKELEEEQQIVIVRGGEGGEVFV